ncbi:oligosaccharide flippase family protein, partial [Proteus mirabilis]|uniref:oligosaccharide flippase family protein n=1 Tax=Proteus mirabilis TaxID=584 RepID=UPI001B382536
TISIATVITNYGLDISVAKRIAEGENKKENLNEFLYQVNIIKSFICFFTIIIVAYILYATNYFTDNPTNIYIILLSIVFSSYNLIWLFQGLEKIYIYSRITIVTRLLSMFLIIITIKSSSDFSLLLLLNFLQILVSIIASYYIIFNWNLKFKTCSIKKSIFLFKESTEYFISRVGVTLYSSACSFFLGIFSGSLHQVAIYGTAEQLYRAGVYLMSAISSPLTPYMARTKNYTIFWKIVVFTLIITILGASIGFVFGDDIIRLIYGSKFNDSYSILNVFMLTIIISVMGMFFGYPALIPIGKTKIANYSV